MKYTAILTGGVVLYWCWAFVSAVLDRGLPTQPLFYLAAVIGIAIGFLTYRSTKSKKTKRLYSLIGILIFILAFTFGFLGILILRQLGSGLFTGYLFSSLGFWGFHLFQKWRLKNKSTEADENTEYASRGIVLMIVFLILALSPIIILALVAFLLFK